MVRLDTDKPINPSQLGMELGRIPVRHVEGRYVDVDGVTVDALQVAVDAHVADPGWVDPDAPPPPSMPSLQAQINDLRERVAAPAAAVTGAAASSLDPATRKAIANATTIDQLKSALLNTGGKP